MKARIEKISSCLYNVAAVLAFIKSVYAFDLIFSCLGDYSYMVNQKELSTVWAELNLWIKTMSFLVYVATGIRYI